MQVANEHCFDWHRSGAGVEQLSYLERACRIWLGIVDVAHPIEISGCEKARVDDVFLSPEFESEIEQDVGMLCIDFGSHLPDAFIDSDQRFGPVAVVVSFCPAARGFAV